MKTKLKPKSVWLLITSSIVLVLSITYLVSHYKINGEREILLDKNQLNTVNSIIINEQNDSIRSSTLIIEYLSDLLELDKNDIRKNIVEKYGIKHLPSILPTYTFYVKSYFWLASAKVYLEVIFWSLFGLLANLLYSVTRAQKFDKTRVYEHIGKFFYTPFLSLIIYFSIDALINNGAVSFESIGKGTIILSFILGFFTRRAIILLGKVKDLILPTGNESLESGNEEVENDTNKIEGKLSIENIREEEFKNNIEFAVVRLISTTSDFIKVINPQNDGCFQFTDIPIGIYLIEAELVINTTRYFYQGEIHINDNISTANLQLVLSEAELIIT